MKTTIDLTEDASFPEGDELPPSVLTDDGDTVLTFGDVSVRMTCLQFQRVLDAMNAWMNALPPTTEHEL